MLAKASGWSSGLRRMRFFGRQATEAAALLLLMMMFACLPIDWASALGAYIGRRLGPRLGASRRALQNLRRAMPENTDCENRRIVLGMWDNLGRSVAEYPHLARICSATSGRVEIVNCADIADLLTGGRPAILFGGHFANWEVGPATVHRLMGASLLSVYRAANNPWIDRLLRHRLRARHAVPKGSEAGRALLRHLRDGGHVAMLVDQKQNDGIAVPFFGIDAMTAPAAARLALRFGCPLVPVVVERCAGARFRVTVMPAIRVGEEATSILTTMTKVNAVIEAWARARPEQWLWIHRRWPDEISSRKRLATEPSPSRSASAREPARAAGRRP
jgi:Kdo2-lipid IVA lauroyltransferase/acyltransferase